jgi:Protein of unknown function (DUF2917)
MKFDLDQSTIQLTEGNLISLPDAKGSTIAVLWGSVWLTQDGDRRDHEVNAGESFDVNGDGMVVISAFENSALAVLQPCEGDARSTPNGEASDRSIAYISEEELRQYKHNAQKLRADYIASLFTSLGKAFRRGFSKLGDFAVALWLHGARQKWTEPSRRLYW